MPIAALIAGLFGPAVDLIKKLISKDEDKTLALAKLEEVQNQIVSTYVELEKQKYTLMNTEAVSESWLVASWRPVCSILIVGIIVLGSFGLCKVGPDIYNLAQIFLGVYGSSRGLEKITTAIVSRK